MLDPSKKGLRGDQGFFLALTFVVLVIIVFTSKDLTAAILVIGLITNFLIISTQLTLMSDRHAGDQEGEAVDKALGSAIMVNPGPATAISAENANLMAGLEKYTRRPAPRPPAPRDPPPASRARERFMSTATTAPPGAGAPAWVNVPPAAGAQPAGKYPGAVEFDEYETAPALGHTDWSAEARDDVPVGNPYAPGRVASPQAAPPCTDDDAIAYFDGDEQNALQVRSRNQPERVWAGIYRRKALVDRYVNGELEEAEASRWWGQGEL